MSASSFLRITAWRKNPKPLMDARADPGERRRTFWSKDEDALLGTMSDRKLAKTIGRSVRAVRHRRNARHIWFDRKPWRPEDDKILGIRSDSQVAKLLGRRILTVALRRRTLGIPCFYEHRPWKDYELEMLGVKSDEEVARLTGHPLGAVEVKRQRLKKPKPNPIIQPWTPLQTALLGTMPDRELAKRLQCNRLRIAHKRRKLKILPHRR